MMSEASSEAKAGPAYEWLTPREAVIKRPDTYVGSTVPCEYDAAVLDAEGTRHSLRCHVAPALLQTFYEMLTNAIDHALRDHKMSWLRVTVNGDAEFSVANNGSATLPLDDWPGAAVPTPQVLFHELHSGSNYRDDRAEATGGRNGMGGKIVNYLSEWFEIECCDAAAGIAYRQRFDTNGLNVGAPQRGAYRLKECRTTVRWKADLALFGMAAPLDEDVVMALVGQAVDTAACTRAQVYVNDVRVACKGFRQYAIAFGGKLLGSDSVWDDQGLGVEVHVTDQGSDTPPSHVAFVNGIRCKGTLLDAVVRQLCAPLCDKYGALGPRAVHATVLEAVSIFVCSRMRNPTFDRQTKENLTTTPAKFGFVLPACGAVAKKLEHDAALRQALADRCTARRGKAAQSKIRLAAKSASIPKYEASTGRGGECTLWVTEGDSAKGFVVSGFSVIGRAQNGVFPLRGKLLNACDITAARALENTEILNLVAILGLEVGKQYDAGAVRRLPYQRLMVVTDQDGDGSHITGLVFVLFYKHFPTLLQAGWRIERFVTPLIRVRVAGSAAPRDFFCSAAYREWFAALSASEARRVQQVRYYKGLGTSTSAEAKEYFGAMGRHTKRFTGSVEEATRALHAMFSKTAVAERKQAILDHDAGDVLDYREERVSVADFCRRELVAFFLADAVRSIPCMVDGLKPSQRKILYTLRRHPGIHKVAQLAADVAKQTNYHHGEQSLQQAIVGMCQDWPSANHVPLLQPLGQFGDAHGTKAASPRYIFTELAEATKLLLPAADDPVLVRVVEEARPVEVEWFCPILPLVLINGCDGIGTGWSTTVPPHLPADVLARCRAIAVAEDTSCDIGPPLLPNFEGFTGGVAHTTATSGAVTSVFTGAVRRYACTQSWCRSDGEAGGVVHPCPARLLARFVEAVDGGHDALTLSAKEAGLVGAGTDGVFVGDVLAVPHALGCAHFRPVSPDPSRLLVVSVPPMSKTYDLLEAWNGMAGVAAVNHTTGDDVRVEVRFEEGVPDDPVRVLKLTGHSVTQNMHLFGHDGRLARFESAEEILRAHARVRVCVYERRRVAAVAALMEAIRVERAKAAYVERVRSGSLRPLELTRDELHGELGDDAAFLLKMSVEQMTVDAAEARRASVATQEAQCDELRRVTPFAMWLRELDAYGATLQHEPGRQARKRKVEEGGAAPGSGDVPL